MGLDLSSSLKDGGVPTMAIIGGGGGVGGGGGGVSSLQEFSGRNSGRALSKNNMSLVPSYENILTSRHSMTSLSRSVGMHTRNY